jgi:hypothetical protein
MRIPILGISVDERFLTHRLRSTSIAGMAGGWVAMGLFAFRFYHDHVWSWDLLSVGLTMAIVKTSLILYYRFTD